MPDVLGGESFDVSGRSPSDATPASTREAVELLDESMRRAREWIAGLGDGIHGTWRLVRGDEELMAMPRAMAIRTLLLNHLYHHRGQLSAYLRAAGEKVPAVYGPTADEDPFG